MRIIYRLRIWQKMLLLGALLALPYPVLIYVFVAESGKSIEFGQKEIYGVDYTLPLVRTMVETLRGDATPQQAAAIEELEALQLRHGTTLATVERYGELQTLLTSSSYGAAEHRHAVLQLLQRLNDDVADSSNLILDPDLDSYYLMDIATLRLPTLLVSLSTLQQQLDSFSGDQLAPAQAEQLLMRLVLLEEAHQAVERSLGVAIENNSSLALLRQSQFTGYDGAMRSHLSLLRSSVEQGLLPPEAVVSESSLALYDTTQLFYTAVSAELRHLLSERITGFAMQRTLTLLYVAILLLVASSIALLLVRSIVSPLQLLQQKLSEIASGGGDLTSRLRQPDDRDLAQLSQSFNRFVESLQRIIGETASTAVRQASSAEEMSATIDQLSRSIQNEAATMEEISASIEEVAASSEHISATVGDELLSLSDLLNKMDELSKIIVSINEVISKTSHLTADVVAQADQGQTHLNQTMEMMSEIHDSSSKITDIVRIINEISEQINLLSLNASIEAARAGDAGRGFAVVAEEVSKLAERTSSSIKDISSLIERNGELIGGGTTIVQDSVASIQRVISGVDTINQRIQEISSFMPQEESIKEEVYLSAERLRLKSQTIQDVTSEQRSSIEDVAKSISQINESAQQSAAGAEELLAAAAEASRSAEGLRKLVESFRI